MLAQAARLVSTGAARHVLVVAGEDRASGQTREASTRVLAQVGHAAYEVPLGGTVPAYYALLASRYLWTYGLEHEALASLPVQMRAHAARKLGAQFQKPITVEDVVTSRPVAEPLRLLDCCPVSDGGAAFVVSAAPTGERSLGIAGTGQAHRHQHLSAMEPGSTGAALAAQRALAEAELDVGGRRRVRDLRQLLHHRGDAGGGAGPDPARPGRCLCRAGAFEVDGRYPMNTHGGLLSYGHCGVGGGMAHLAEVAAQLRHERGAGQVGGCEVGYVHADGGVLSAHVGVVLRRGR